MKWNKMWTAYILSGLALLSGLAVVLCGSYCIWIWIPPEKLTFFQLDESFVCWLWCSTLSPTWAVLTLISGILIIAGTLMVGRGNCKGGVFLCLIFGFLTLPIGIFPLYLAWTHRYHLRNEK